MKLKQNYGELNDLNKAIYFFSALFAILFSIIILRFAEVQILHGKEWSSKQQVYNWKNKTLPRGEIRDRNQQILVTNIHRYNYALAFSLSKQAPEYSFNPVKDSFGFLGRYLQYIPGFYAKTIIVEPQDFCLKFIDQLKTEYRTYYSYYKGKRREYYRFRGLSQKQLDRINTLSKRKLDKYIEQYPEDMRKPIKRTIWRYFRKHCLKENADKRKYLYSATAAHILGVYSGAKTGAEKYLHDIIKSKTMRFYGSKSHQISEFPEIQKHAVLTIDIELQQKVEEILNRKLKELEAQMGFAIVMDCNTGEILSLANYPTYHPEKFNQYIRFKNETIQEGNNYMIDDMDTENNDNDQELHRKKVSWLKRFDNIACSYRYEPGSIVKVFTVAGALDQNVVTPETIYNCHRGRKRFTNIKKTLKDTHHLGEVTVTDILKFSSNIGTALIAIDMGKELLYEKLVNFGFNSSFNIYAKKTLQKNFSYPVNCVRHHEKWTPQSITMVPIGQELSLTGIQIISAFNSVVNGGIYHTPHVLKSIMYAEKNISLNNVKSWRTIAPETSEQMRTILSTVTDWDREYLKRGTGTKARLKKYKDVKVGGKTGTAQFFDRDLRTYHKGKYIGSFIGCFPIEKPRYSVLVSVFFPTYKKRYGGDCAAPVFSEIGDAIMDQEAAAK